MELLREWYRLKSSCEKLEKELNKTLKDGFQVTKLEQQIVTENILYNMFGLITDYGSRYMGGITINDSDDFLIPDEDYFCKYTKNEFEAKKYMEVAKLCYYNIREILREHDNEKRQDFTKKL